MKISSAGPSFRKDLYARSFFDGRIVKISSYGLDILVGLGNEDANSSDTNLGIAVSFNPYIRIYEGDFVSIDLKMTNISMLAPYISLNPEFQWYGSNFASVNMKTTHRFITKYLFIGAGPVLTINNMVHIGLEEVLVVCD